MKINTFIAFAFFLMAMLSCGREPHRESAPLHSTITTFNTDAKALQQLIDLPFTPVAAKWEVKKIGLDSAMAPGPDDWGIIALIELRKEDADLLRPATLPGGEQGVLKSNTQPWLSNALDLYFTLDAKGRFYTALVPALAIEQFQKPPLLTGAAFRISETQVLVYLQTL